MAQTAPPTKGTRFSTDHREPEIPLHPEIQSAVSLSLAHAHKVYFSGPLVRRIERQPDGQRPNKDEGWTDVWAQLGGSTLSIWNMKEIKKASEEGREVPPMYVNVTDAFVQVLGSVTVPATANSPPKRYPNVLTLNTAGSNLLLFTCPSPAALISWAASLRLSAWEKSRLEEIYTACMIRITLRSPNVPSDLVRGSMEGWVEIRVAGQTDWKLLYMVLNNSTGTASPATQSGHTGPSGKKKRMSNIFSRDPGPPRSNGPSKAMISLYTSPTAKDRRKAILSMREISQAFAVYPERPELINRSTLIKVEGLIGDEEIAAGMRCREGWLLIMPELEGSVGQSDAMLKWILAIHDAFELYGRPRAYTWDPRDPISMMFAYPVGPHKDLLFLDRESAESLDPREDRTSEVRSHLCQLLLQKLRANDVAPPPKAPDAPIVPALPLTALSPPAFVAPQGSLTPVGLPQQLLNEAGPSFDVDRFEPESNTRSRQLQIQLPSGKLLPRTPAHERPPDYQTILETTKHSLYPGGDSYWDRSTALLNLHQNKDGEAANRQGQRYHGSVNNTRVMGSRATGNMNVTFQLSSHFSPSEQVIEHDTGSRAPPAARQSSVHERSRPNGKRKSIIIGAADGARNEVADVPLEEDLSPHFFQRDIYPIDGGSYGDLFKALWIPRNEVVAMKMMRFTDREGTIRRRFQRETNIWSKLCHPHVLHLYGTCEEGPSLFFISPWEENGNSLVYLRNNRHANRKMILRQTANALAYLHAGEGIPIIVHGDIKAENILISRSGHALLADFGLSKLVEDVSRGAATSTVKISQMAHGYMEAYTKPQDIRGALTTRFAAPKLFSDSGSKTTESDVWAFGCFLLQIFTENVPFAELPNDRLVFRALLDGNHPHRPSAPEPALRGLDDDLWELARECWAVDPRLRPQMSEVELKLD